ncbi:RipA family octameric membrane protein [Helicobacter sp. T3_23-1059]
MDKDLQHKLEKYKILYTAYADEIGNLWKRSIFLATFMTLAWGGYGALQLKHIEKDFTITNLTYNPLNLNVYHCTSLGLCLIIIVLSLLWVAMAKGSKFVQEAHEAHIENLNCDLIYEIDSQTGKLKRYFCNLSNYQDRIEKKNLSSNKLFSSYRYSPSKINIALGWISFAAAIILSVIHAFMFLDMPNCLCALFFIVLFVVAVAMPLITYFKQCLKGGK